MKRVVVTGATGNVGTSVIEVLSRDAHVDSLIGVARRPPSKSVPKVKWVEADVASADLGRIVSGADAIVHLAWAIQPSHRPELLRRINVEGSKRVFRAAADKGVGSVIYASSVGTYSPGPKDRAVDESWPAHGISSSDYSRHKAEVEAMLDSFESEHRSIRVVRLRPGLTFKRDAASGIRRLFLGPLFPAFLLRRSLIPVVPLSRSLRFQAVHSLDVGEAYRRALVEDVHGPFNIAADPVLDLDRIAALLKANPLSLPPQWLKRGADITWRLHLQPTHSGWLDMGLQTPIMDVTRARTELHWTPRRSSEAALLELIDGIREGAGADTPPLAPSTGGPLRIKEILTGVGQRT
jgi:UDP-glucose 4-epimerase